MPPFTWLQKVIPSPLADHLPTALARSVAPGEEPPVHRTVRGKERAKGHQPMEYADWTPQAVATLFVGLIATVGLAVAMVYAFIKGER
jgi:hypothetical protein